MKSKKNVKGKLNCVICGSKNTVKHHINYAEDEVVPLCRSCHNSVHFDPSSKYYPEDSPRTQAVIASTKIPSTLREMIEETITRDLHVSVSDFLRDAVKFYIREGWPQIYEKYSGETVRRERD